MLGTVQMLNLHTARAAIDTDGEGLTVVELVDVIELELGDTVTGPLDEYGAQQFRLKHVAGAQRFDGYVQAIRLRRDEAHALLTGSPQTLRA